MDKQSSVSDPGLTESGYGSRHFAGFGSRPFLNLDPIKSYTMSLKPPYRGLQAPKEILAIQKAL
jgi:hypothetical protein